MTVLQLLATKEVTWLGIGEGLVYALLGFAITFIGIIVLIAFVWAFSKIMNSVRNSKKVKKQDLPASAAEDAAEDGEVPIEIRLAIIAAIAAYYEGENTTCEFKVRRIKKL